MKNLSIMSLVFDFFYCFLSAPFSKLLTNLTVSISLPAMSFKIATSLSLSFFKLAYCSENSIFGLSLFNLSYYSSNSVQLLTSLLNSYFFVVLYFLSFVLILLVRPALISSGLIGGFLGSWSLLLRDYSSF